MSPKELPTPMSSEVRAVSAYLTWLSRGSEVGKKPWWRGQNALAAARLIPIVNLDPRKGEATYGDRCVTCQWTRLAGRRDRRQESRAALGTWVAERRCRGGARLHARRHDPRFHAVPRPGQDDRRGRAAAPAFINSKRRPVFPFKDRDYRTEKLPPDAVYYARR